MKISNESYVQIKYKIIVKTQNKHELIIDQLSNKEMKNTNKSNISRTLISRTLININ